MSMEDLKEEERSMDDRERSRGSQNESPTEMLQKKLESLVQFKLKYDPKNEFFDNIMLVFYNQNINISKDTKNTEHTEDTEDTEIDDIHSRYTDALKTISKKDEELQIARSQYRQMAEQLNKYKQKYTLDAANDDNKEDETKSDRDETVTEPTEEKKSNISITVELMDNNHLQSQPSNPLHSINQCNKSTCNDLLDPNAIKNNSMEDDNGDSDMDGSSSDYPLMNDHITFKPPEEYPPITFRRIVPLTVLYDEFDGIQSDWDCNLSNGINQEQDDNDDGDEEDEEDEYVELINALNRLQIINEKLQKDLDDKCMECEALKSQLFKYRKNE